jgi:hypothetical protein
VIHLGRKRVHGLLHTSHIIFEGSNISVDGSSVGIDVVDVTLVLFIIGEQVGDFLLAGEIHLGISGKGVGGSTQKTR